MDQKLSYYYFIGYLERFKVINFIVILVTRVTKTIIARFAEDGEISVSIELHNTFEEIRESFPLILIWRDVVPLESVQSSIIEHQLDATPCLR